MLRPSIWTGPWSCAGAMRGGVPEGRPVSARSPQLAMASRAKQRCVSSRSGGRAPDRLSRERVAGHRDVRAAELPVGPHGDRLLAAARAERNLGVEAGGAGDHLEVAAAAMPLE